MNNVVIIADDLTGAADTGVQFCPFFEDTTLVSYQKLEQLLEPRPSAGSQATAVYTDSRALAAEEARQRVAAVGRRLVALQPLWIYKKIDSCMRGNVGAEADALLDALGCEVSFIAPAFPEMGRTTENDIHRVHGIPLDRTEIARDPIAPVKEAKLSRIVQAKSGYSVGHVAAAFLDGTESELQAEIHRKIRSGFRHLVFDAANRKHLDRIAGLVYDLPAKVLPVGSAGLAGSLTKSLGLCRKPVTLRPKPAGAGCNLLVCGTASKVTARQIENLVSTYACEWIRLPSRLLAEQVLCDELAQAASAAGSTLMKKSVILTIAQQPSDPAAAGKEQLQPMAYAVAGGLGLFAAEVLAHTRPGHLFLTGGDTADAVMTAVEAGGIRILAEAAVGVVEGELFGGPLDGLPVVTKAGAFGQDDTLVALYEGWQKKV